MRGAKASKRFNVYYRVQEASDAKNILYGGFKTYTREEEDKAAVRLNYNFSAPARSDSTCTSGYGRLIILSSKFTTCS